MSKNLHIAYFKDGPFLPPREGGSYVTLNTLRNLEIYNIRPHIIRCFRGWDNPDLYENENFDSYILRPKDYFFNFELIQKILNQNNIKISIFESVEAGLSHIPYFRKNIQDVVCVTDCHNIEYVLMQRLLGNSDDVEKMKIMEKTMVNMSDGVLVRSEKDKDDLMDLQLHFDDQQKIHIIKNSIPVENFEWKLREPTRNCVYIGHMYYGPNQECVRLLYNKVFPKLWEKDPDWQLKVIGIGPNDFFRSFKDERIEFVGEVDNLNEAFQDTYMALCPILSGSGTRLKVLDFFASGIPVIGTQICVEGLENNIGDVMVIEDDIEKYANQVEILYSNRNSYKKYAEEGRNWVLESRTEKHMAQSVANALFRINNDYESKNNRSL